MYSIENTWIYCLSFVSLYLMILDVRFEEWQEFLWMRSWNLVVVRKRRWSRPPFDWILFDAAWVRHVLYARRYEEAHLVALRGIWSVSSGWPSIGIRLSYKKRETRTKSTSPVITWNLIPLSLIFFNLFALTECVKQANCWFLIPGPNILGRCAHRRSKRFFTMSLLLLNWQ